MTSAILHHLYSLSCYYFVPQPRWDLSGQRKFFFTILAGKCCKHVAFLVYPRKNSIFGCYLPLVTYYSLNIGRPRGRKFDLVPEDGAQGCLSQDFLFGCVVNIWVD